MTFPFPFFSGGAGASSNYLGRVAVTASGTSSSGTLNVGSYESNMLLVGIIGYRDGSSSNYYDSATFGGASASLIVRQNDNNSGIDVCEMWAATLNTGGSITVTFDQGAGDRSGIQPTFYLIKNLQSNTVAYTEDVIGRTTGTFTGGATSNQVALVAEFNWVNSGTGRTCTWGSGVVEDYDGINVVGGSSTQYFSCASKQAGTPGFSGLTGTLSSGANAGSWVMAVWEWLWKNYY